MRLFQLAREVSKTSKEIIDFLHSQGINRYSGSNSKMDDEHVQMILHQFKPESFSSYEKNDPVYLEDRAREPEEQGTEVSAKLEPQSEKKSDQGNIQPGSEEAEVIRAPKIKLQGVKVVGKIELPEKPLRKRETKPDEGSLEMDSKPDHTKRKSKKSSALQKSNRSLSFLEKQKREERKREKQKKDRLKKEREKKRIHYQKNVQFKILPAQPKKKLRSSEKREESLSHRNITPTYKNPIKRFWAWLNGAFDQY